MYEDTLRFEGSIPHLYLDSKGNVTVGVGHLVTSADAAMAIPGWIRPESVKSDYAALQQIAKNGPEFLLRHSAKYYETATIARLSADAIKSLLASDMEREVGILKRSVPGYDSYPLPARRALSDMAFNLGGNFLQSRNKDGNLVWLRFFPAALHQNWQVCAEQCKRADVAEERNAWTRQQFTDCFGW